MSPSALNVGQALCCPILAITLTAAREEHRDVFVSILQVSKQLQDLPVTGPTSHN